MNVFTNDIQARKDFIGPMAGVYLLDVPLVCAVCEQESSWNPWSVRYEAAFHARYIQPLIEKGEVKTATESACRAMSFGLMQIMGQTARELGFTGVFLSELCDPKLGTDFGCKKLRRCFDLKVDASAALLAYNGGGDPNYPRMVLDRMRKYF